MSVKQNIETIFKKIHPILWQFICILVASIVFILILVNRSPFLLRPVSMALRTGFGISIPLAALVMYVAYRVPNRLGELISLTFTMALFALGLAGLWASGNTQSVILNGLIPLTDAAGYYADALRLHYGMDVSTFTAMRPFHAGLLSFFLLLANGNLMVAVSIFTAIAGFATYLACREIQKTHSVELAVFILMMMFLYYRHHSGTTMSESFSVPVSLFGVAFLWRGISNRHEWTTLFGIGMIALALNIRPGAMFVLPALLLWGGWVFRGERKFSFKFFGLGTGLILLTFIANGRMVDFVSGSQGIAFQNFSWALYGLSSGGKSWTFIFQAHPELANLPDNEVNKTIYKLAFQQMLSNPLLTLQGAFLYWRMFFSNTWYNAYAFVAGENYWVNQAARWSMYLLGILGIGKWTRNRTDPYASLAVVTALGVLASVPFVPPTDAYRVRLYAATIPFFATLPGMGLFFLQESIEKRISNPFPKIIPTENYSISAFSLIIIVIMICAPVLIKTNGSLPTLLTDTCPAGLDSFYTKFSQGTFINIKRENIQFLDWMPDFHMSLFRRNAHSLPDIDLITALETLPPMNSIFYSLDLSTNREAIVIIGTDMLPKPGMVRFCGEFDSHNSAPYVLFYVEEVHPIAEH